MSTTLRVQSNDDLAALAPRLLGFHPEQSVVVLADGGGNQMHLRFDIDPDPAEVPADGSRTELVAAYDTVAADQSTRLLRSRDTTLVAILLYTDDLERATALTTHLTGAYTAAGISVSRAAHVHAGHTRAWTGTRFSDTPVPVNVPAHPFTLDALLAGQHIHDSRAALRATLDTAFPAETALVAAELPAAMTRIVEAVDGHDGDAYLSRQRAWLTTTMQQQARAEAAGELGAADVAAITALLHLTPLRDAAIVDVDTTLARNLADAWATILRRTPASAAAPAATVLAYWSWVSGNGALARCALEKAQQAQPGYRLAELLELALDVGVDPHELDPATFTESASSR